MKIIHIVLLVSFLTGCGPEAVLPDTASTILDVKKQPNWKTEKLDNTYMIQFPKNYKGGIGPTIEGPEFSLVRNDQAVYFLAPMVLLGGGTLLPTPQPKSITHVNLVLDRMVTFRRDGKLQGVFYYAEQPKTTGKIYLVQNGRLAFSMIVQYDFASHREVLGILQTIRPN